MKHQFILLTTALLLGACNNNKEATHAQKSSDGTTAATVNKNEDAEDVSGDDAFDKREKELQKLIPLSRKELSSLLPKKVTDFELKSYIVKKISELNPILPTEKNIDIFFAEYINDKGVEIKLEANDCAGEGTSFYSVVMLGNTLLGYQDSTVINHDDLNGDSKYIRFMGGIAFEEIDENNNEIHFSYIVNDRFNIRLCCDKAEAEKLKSFAKNLKLNL